MSDKNECFTKLQTTKNFQASRRTAMKAFGAGAASLVAMPHAVASGLNSKSQPSPDSIKTPSAKPSAKFPYDEHMVDPDIIYINAASLAPTFKKAFEAQHAMALSVQHDPSYQHRTEFRAVAEMVRGKLADYVGAFPDEIAMMRNTSEGNCAIVNGLKLNSGDEVIITADNHQSNRLNWQRRALRDGLVIKVADVPIHAGTSAEVLESITALVTQKTRVIALSHLTNTTGLLYPIKQLSAFAREKDIWVHVDGAQNFGWQVLDLHDLGCDSYAGSTHKWMMGPVEAGVLFIREERISSIDPSIVSVDQWVEYGVPLQGARKFEQLGQRDDSRLAGIGATLDLVNELGLAAIEARVMALANYLRRALLDIPAVRLLGTSNSALIGPIMRANWPGASPQMPDGDGMSADEMSEILWTHHRIAVTSGSLGLRFSPHIYNSEEEMDYVADLVRELLGSHR